MRSVVLFVGLGWLAGLVPDALAQPWPTVVPYDSYGTTGGGEFRLRYANFPFAPVSLAGTEAPWFESFCLEKHEELHLGTTYYVRVATEAVHGGVGGGVGDPLDPRTAYLYSRFIAGTLSGYVYDGIHNPRGRIASANALQHVIWYIEHEEPKAWHSGDHSLMDKFYRDAQAHAASGIGDVRVLNLFTSPHRCGYAQDQLVMMPEPSGVALVGLGLAVLMLVRRRV